jgi:hypothetical protein
MEWLIDNVSVPNASSHSGSDLLFATGVGTEARRAAKKQPRAFAIRLNELIVRNNRAWFGEDDIRLDALVIHGNGSQSAASDFYQPKTFSFPRIASGDSLPIDNPGLLLFFGRPLYFIDLFLLVSRDNPGSDSLAKLFTKGLPSQSIDKVFKPLIQLASSEITSNLIALSLQASMEVGNLAYRVIQSVTNNTIGLYRTSFLQAADNFGIGPHPDEGHLTIKDFSFRYEILLA